MTDEEKNLLKEGLKDSSAFQDVFFNFKMQSKFQLLLNQLQFTQSLGGIALALVAIGVGTSKIELSIWTLFSIGFASALLIYSSSLHREIIDLNDRGLNETSDLLKSKHSQLIEKVTESLEKDDYNIYYNYLKNDVNSSKEVLISHQIGEIVVFLFLNTLGFGLLSILNLQIDLINQLVFIIIILLGTYLISFKEWSYRLTTLLSKPFRKKS
jgi:hypothetical protein